MLKIKKREKTKEDKFNDGYYHIERLLEIDANYYMVFGERSSGKTTSCLMYALEEYVKNGKQFAYIRRWDIDARGKGPANLFNFLSSSGFISKITNGEYNSVFYRNGCFYLSKYDSEEMSRVNSFEPCGFIFALNNMEHDKSSAYPMIKNIIFDEFLTRTTYLVDEFVIFCNVLSTIIRDRNDVKIFMLGNTINKYCPYFKEMGLNNVKKMKPGDVDIYKYGETKLKVVVEYTGGPNLRSEKPSDMYFAFDNPKLNMITNGGWELDIYPHCPKKYVPKDVKITYFVEFDDEILQCEVVKKDKCIFTFIHRKTTKIKNPDKDLIFSQCYDPRKNHRRNIMKPYDEIGSFIWSQYVQDNIYYQDNDVGDIMMNYLNWCKQN